MESYEGQTRSESGHAVVKKIKKQACLSVSSCNRSVCVMCTQPHRLDYCSRFKAMKLQDRYDFVKRKRLCFNCFFAHSVRDCRLPPCQHCQRRHHSLLHGLPYQEKKPASTCSPGDSVISAAISDDRQASAPADTAGASADISATALHSVCNVKQVLLSTALIVVQDKHGQRLPCRAVLDNGSQVNIITQKLSNKLGLDVTRAMLPISGVNGVNTRSSQWVNVTISSFHSQYTNVIGCHVLPAVTFPLPAQPINTVSWEFPDAVKNSLADPGFNCTTDVDLLLGAEIYYEVVWSQPTVMPGGLPWLYNTAFGWIISGPIATEHNQEVSSQRTSCLLTAGIWLAVKEPRNSKYVDEVACELHFQKTHGRQSDGRFIVSLPFRDGSGSLGRSMESALHRFLSLERKLQRNTELHKEYCEFMNEYRKLGHMSLIEDPVLQTGQYYYLPHHAVFKASSTTTKMRVVFDASMKTSINLSLNDVLLAGAVIQSELFDIVLRFRLHMIVITADVAKMYRQVLINENDRSFQRILWRDSPDKPLIHFALNTVTYGTVPASFLATRVLKQLAVECAEQSPEVSQSILRDFYMDDYISGANSDNEAEIMHRDVAKVLESGGMLLRKWCSNSEQMRRIFSETSNVSHYSLNLSPDETTTSLGLNWCPTSDTLLFLNKSEISRLSKTKRELLSTLNSVFDPLGFLGPVLIRGKVFLQELWQLKIEWDDELPSHIQTRWRLFLEDLNNLSKLKIPRLAKINNRGRIELHGFCDASQIAFGACIYLRQLTGAGTWGVHLLCAKSRVAPTKTLTIPRLELSGSLLLSELMCRVSKAINVSLDNIYCWCDSTVVLAWINGVPAQWKTYVANRVTQIIENVGAGSWRHISTHQNPADPLSRGVTTQVLLDLNI